MLQMLSTLGFFFFPTKKPWMTREVQNLLEKSNIAFRSGEKARSSIARAEGGHQRIKGGLCEDNRRQTITEQPLEGCGKAYNTSQTTKAAATTL